MENVRDRNEKLLRKGPLAVLSGDQVFRILTALFAGLAVLVLGAMALQMARGG